MKRYKAVFFDFDGTLAYAEPEFFARFLSFCQEVGLTVGDEAARRGERFSHLYLGSKIGSQRLVRLGEEAFWRHFTRLALQEMGVRGDVEDYVEAIGERFMAAGPGQMVCPPSVSRTLAHLQAEGYMLGVISNRGRELEALCEEFDLAQYLTFILPLNRAGSLKANPWIFEAALREAEVAPEEAVYVGDDYIADVVGAQWAGLTAILLDPRGLFPEADCIVVNRIEEILQWV
ncbi:MAG: HAD family hydrolase [Anaerolineae bacterium]